MTKNGKVLRGGLYVAIAMLGTLLGDEIFRSAIMAHCPIFLSIGGSIVAGLVALRAFVDTSAGEVEPASLPDPLSIKSVQVAGAPVEATVSASVSVPVVAPGPESADNGGGAA